MAKKPHTSDAAVAAALELAGERGWRSLSLAEIAERAGLPLADLVDRFPDKAHLFGAYLKSVDARMLAGSFDAREPARDRLFEVMMRRFEAMAADRRGLGAILRDSGGDPVLLLCGLRRLRRTMALTLEAAGLSSSGLGGLLRTQGLAAIYLAAFKAFLDDDTPDLSRTMTALDKALRRAEGIAAMLWGRDDGFHHAGPAEGEA